MSFDDFIQKMGTTANSRALLGLHIDMWQGVVPYGDATLQSKTYKKRVGSGSVNCLLLAGLLSLNACGDSNEQDDIITSIDGVNIKHGITNREGKKTFLDDQIEGNTADLTIKNDFGNPIVDVEILFADGYLFEMFLLVHPGYEPQLQIALHNSEHIYSLTPAPLQFLHHNNKIGQERSFWGAENAFRWTKSWQNPGCYDREGLGNAMKPGAILVKKVASYFTVGVSDLFIGDLAELLKNQMDDDDIAEVRSFIPSNYGIYGSTTTITALEIKKGSCDGFIEENIEEEKPEDNYKCKDTIFCDHFNGNTKDLSDKWNYQGSASLDNGWLKLEDASAQAKINFPCNNVKIDFSAVVDGSYGVYLGEGIAIYGDGDSLQYVCGSEGKVVPAGTDVRVVKNDNSLNIIVNGSYKNPIPCQGQIDRVNLSAGDLSELRSDYVEVRCE